MSAIESTLGRIEGRLTSIEVSLEELRREARTHVRVFLGAVIAFGLCLTGLSAEGFHWL